MESARKPAPKPPSADTPSKSLIIKQIVEHQLHGKEECTLEYTNVDHNTALAVINHLRNKNEHRSHRLSYNSVLKTFAVVLMPTQLHECAGDWINTAACKMIATNWISMLERTYIQVLSSPDNFPFENPYKLSHKEPDLCVIPYESKLPTIVCECGWSESKVKLIEDMRIWLVGGKPTVKLVFIVKFTRLTKNRISGYVETYERDENHVPQLVQKETIFPAPSSAQLAAAQVITITRAQLWGPHLPAGQNPDDTFLLDLDHFRHVAKKFIRELGCVPA